MSEKKKWTVFDGSTKDAVKDTEWMDMLMVILSGKEIDIKIVVTEK